MTEKTLPEIYREAAELVLKTGKVEGDMKRLRMDASGHYDFNAPCLGFCTMGAVFEVTGNLEENGHTSFEFDESSEFVRLTKPIADQIVSSGRGENTEGENTEGERAFLVIALWNDEKSEGKKPSAEDVAALLRETADAVEVTV